MHWGWNGSDWVWMTIGMILFWGALVAVIWAIVRSKHDGSRPEQLDATDTLAQRFARGEITEEDYRERLQVLREAS